LRLRLIYELIAGASQLSAGRQHLQFSTVIGSYLLVMGIGSSSSCITAWGSFRRD
jgi:predicted membrane-bound spermidine synthase